MRWGLVIVALLVVIGSLAAIKASQIGLILGHGEAAVAAGPPPEYVGTARSFTRDLRPEVTTIGTVTSVQGVEVRNEEPGRVETIEFESGDQVEKGDVLVRLDASVEEAQLEEARSRARLAKIAYERTARLAAQGAEAAAVLDEDKSALETAVAQVRALQATIERKTVRAPFSGRLGIRQVNLGEYLQAGTVITVLEAQESVFVDFTLPQENLDEVAVGKPVAFRLPRGGEDRVDATLEGTIEAIAPSVDADTRALQLRARVEEGADQLRPGMFIRVALPTGAPSSVTMVPLTAIVHAPYGDSVFVIQDKPPDDPGLRATEDGEPIQIARQRFVQTGPAQGDFVAVLEGLESGLDVVTAGAFKLSNNAPVVVDDSVQPRPSLTPEVANR